jgi:hypothetical protein
MELLSLRTGNDVGIAEQRIGDESQVRLGPIRADAPSIALEQSFAAIDDTAEIILVLGVVFAVGEEQGVADALLELEKLFSRRKQGR